jgi:uncharacterized membrane protein
VIRISAWKRGFAGLSLFWAAALPAAAWAGQWPAGSAPRITSVLVYLAGAVVCHQRPDRSFHLGAAALPVCARCTGIYVAAALTALAALWPGDRTMRTWLVDGDTRLSRIAIAIALVPTATTILWEWGIGSTPSNVVRAAAGAPIGAVAAWLVMRAAGAGAQSE